MAHRHYEDEIPPPAEGEGQIKIQLAGQPIKAKRSFDDVPPAYDPDNDDSEEDRKGIELPRDKSRSAVRVVHAMSVANVVEKSHKPLKKIARLGTIRKNVYEEVIIVYKPWFSFLMLIANTGVFIYTMWVANWQFASTSVNPLIGPAVSILDDLGAKDTPKIEAGQWWRLGTTMFLHAGVVHLFMNMLMLKRLGIEIEEGFGMIVTGTIYLLSGLSGALASCVMNPGIIGVGASGALYGLVGALFGDFIQNHKTILEGKWAYLFSMIVSLVVGLGMGLLPVLDNWAHIGGLVCGFLLGLILMTNNMRDARGKRLVPCYSKLLTVLAAIVLVIWFVVLFALLYSSKNGNSYCKWCRYLDCVDTPYWTCPDPTQ